MLEFTGCHGESSKLHAFLSLFKCPLPRVFPSITLVFSHQTFDPLVQVFGDGPTDSMGYKPQVVKLGTSRPRRRQTMV